MLQERLDTLAASSGVVGAQLSVAVDGVQTHVACGLLDSRTDRPATPSSPFRLGSITKTVTATVLRSLLDEHGRSLDEPVEVLLPGTVPPRLGPSPITWRHVLMHRTGIDGTYWPGFGDDAHAIATYAERTADLPTVFPAGASWAYSNTGYVLAGRAIEVLSEASFESAVHERLAPYALSGTTFDLEAPSGAANGHHGMGPDARPADPPMGLRALGPAGSTAFSTAADALSFADQALGTEWQGLDEESIALPAAGGPAATHQALGWKVHRWGGQVVFSHDGGASGQGSFLRWIPATRTGIALLANTAPAAMFLWAGLSAWFFDHSGVTVPGPIESDPDATTDRGLCGEYRSRDATFTVTQPGDLLELAVDALGGSLSTTVTLEPLRPEVYRASAMIADPTQIITFEEVDGFGTLVHCGPFTARR